MTGLDDDENIGLAHYGEIVAPFFENCIKMLTLSILWHL